MAVAIYRGIVKWQKYVEKACVSLPILYPRSGRGIPKNFLSCSICFSSPISHPFPKNDSCYPALSHDFNKGQNHTVGRRFSHTAQGDKPVITLFTKDDCSLCDVAKEKLEKYQSMCHIEHVYIDKEENSMWFEKYKHDIPVIHLNGKFLMKHKVFTGALEEAIKIALTRNNKERRAECHKSTKDESRSNNNMKDIADILTFYSGNFLDRCAHLRKDKEILEAKMREDTSKYVIFKGLQPLLVEIKRNVKKLKILSFTEVSRLLDPNDDIFCNAIYLGTEDDEVDWFALNLPKDSDESLVTEVAKDNAEFTNAFFGMMRLNEMESSIAAQARGILAWHSSHQFCPECGSRSLMVEGGYRRKCTNESCKTRKAASHHACYPRVDPVTMALVLSPDHSKMLLGRKPMFPPGLFTCLAGYVEPGESFEAAVRREIYEECGLPVTNVRYQVSQFWPFPSTIMFGCLATAEHTNIQIDDDELEEVLWFDKDEAARLISRETSKAFMAGERVKTAPGKYALAHHLIKRWLNENN